ncbi:MAG TPA: hypothetical protein VFK13_08270 [Gemmatimonadaceae bacterium]|nr:hypothetical protein [Gemmatimonadaceae bacterium]
MAAIEMVGGAVGVVLAVMIARQLSSAAHLQIWLSLLWVGTPFLLSLAAGILLWRDTALGQGLSLLVLALQVPVVINPSFGYFFNSGLALRVMHSPAGWSSYAELGSQFHMGWAEAVSGPTIGVNVAALALAALLLAAIPTDEGAGPIAGNEGVDAHLPADRASSNQQSSA